MMKRIVATLFFLSLFLLAIALVAPGFIDWSSHKEGILSQLEPYIARKITVDGKVNFRLLPSPQIMLEQVSLANAEGAEAPYFMKLKQLEARLKMQPLLEGRFEIETINLAVPELNLEVLPDGGNNWTGIFRENASIGNAESVHINNAGMTGGTVHFTNRATGTAWEIGNLNLGVTADTLNGPYKAKGDMRYKDTPVAIELSTGKYDRSAPLPVNIAFTPASDMPKVTLSGVADLAAGFDMQAEMNIAGGAVASLFDSDFIKNIEFLNEPAEVSAMLNLKGGGVEITDISGKFGKKGTVTGNISAGFAQGKKPEISAELKGNDIRISGSPHFYDIPAGFTPHLKVSATSATVSGVWLPGVTLNADANDKEWVIKEARFELPGKSLVKIAGVATAATKYGAYSMTVTTDNAGKMLKASGLADNNILKDLGASELVTKLELASSLDLRPDKISIFDIDAKINGDTKVTGVVNIERGKARKFNTILNFDKADITAVLSDAYAPFMAAVMKSDASFAVNVKDFTKGDLPGSDLEFNAKVAGGVLDISRMTGNFTPDGMFSVMGQVSSLNPLSGMNVEYRVRAPALGRLAAYGVALPPPLWGSQPVDLHGNITGDAKQYKFTAEGAAQGAAVALNGTATEGNQGTYSYATDVSLNKASWAQLGLPLDNLLADGKPVDITAQLSGTRAAYTLDKLKAGGVTGTLARKDGGYSGDLDAPAADFDKWLWEDWKLTDAIDLKMKVGKVSWRGDDITNAAFTLEAKPDAVNVTGFTGDIWGGDVAADVKSTRKDGKWDGSLKGKISGADLQQLAKLMELEGFKAGRGDLTLDLTDSDERTKNDWFAGMEGDIGLHADSLTIENFDPGALSAMISAIDGPPTDNFTAEALRGGDTTYRNIDGAFKVGGGKISIAKMKLADSDATVDVKGHYALGPETFKVDAGVTLKHPAGSPAFNVNRAGEMGKAPGYAAVLRPLETWMGQRVAQAPAVAEPLPAEPEVPLPADGGADKQWREVVLPGDSGATPQPDTPIQIYPPPDSGKLPQEGEGGDALPEHPGAVPPPAVTPEDEPAPVINTEQIDTEQLSAPPTVEPAPVAPLPPQTDGQQPDSAQPQGIKGVIDRLNALPPEPEPPAPTLGEQKPDTPRQGEEIFPDEGQ